MSHVADQVVSQVVGGVRLGLPGRHAPSLLRPSAVRSASATPRSSRGSLQIRSVLADVRRVQPTEPQQVRPTGLRCHLATQSPQHQFWRCACHGFTGCFSTCSCRLLFYRSCPARVALAASSCRHPQTLIGSAVELLLARNASYNGKTSLICISVSAGGRPVCLAAIHAGGPEERHPLALVQAQAWKVDGVPLPGCGRRPWPGSRSARSQHLVGAVRVPGRCLLCEGNAASRRRAVAHAFNDAVHRWAWPAYWIAQGTMFWALFVVGHDWCAGCTLPSHAFCIMHQC